MASLAASVARLTHPETPDAARKTGRGAHQPRQLSPGVRRQCPSGYRLDVDRPSVALELTKHRAHRECRPPW